MNERTGVDMMKRLSKRLAVVLAMAMILTSCVFVVQADAASTPDMKKANVKWDLKNNKTLKFNTTWAVIGTKQHTVKMTNYKVRNAKKKGYKQCTFTLTFNRKITPTSKQIDKMAEIAEVLDMYGEESEGGTLGGGFYYAIVDYKTGKELSINNKKKVTVTDSGWKYSKFEKKSVGEDTWIRYPRKATIKIKIVYPKSYKNLAIGVGGYTKAPYYKFDSESGAEEFRTINLNSFWNGKKKFSSETRIYSKDNKNFAHFMRVK